MYGYSACRVGPLLYLFGGVANRGGEASRGRFRRLRDGRVMDGTALGKLRTNELYCMNITTGEWAGVLPSLPEGGMPGGLYGGADALSGSATLDRSAYKASKAE